MAQFCLVVVTYNRKASLERLVSSLQKAHFGGEAVDLVVSIDGGGPDDVPAFASSITWAHGAVVVRRNPANLGLRRHILNCGAIAHNYDAVVILEDDLVVGPEFYRFARWAVHQYDEDERIAGISLYAPSHNEMADLPFQPMLSAFDVYGLQSAQSWGQCWSRRMWSDFEAWYEANGPVLNYAPDMPSRIYSWPESSWKKFAMKYLAETGKTWIYPYHSHTTNCSEIGTHNQVVTAVYQVPLAAGHRTYNYGALDELVQYDLYFERCDTQFAAFIHAGSDRPLLLDLYGARQQVEGPVDLITTRILAQPAVRSFGFAFRPVEANVVMGTEGAIARQYRVDPGVAIDLTQRPVVRPMDYFSNADWRDHLALGVRGLRRAIARRLRRQ